MSIDVAVSRVIPAAPAEVERLAIDPDQVPVWYARIDTAETVSDGSLAVGSKIKFQARFLGRDLIYTYEILEWEPGRRFVMSTSAGPFPMTTEYLWEPVEGGTRMTLRNHGRPSGFSKLVAPVMAVAMKSNMTKDLAKLADLVAGS